MKTRYNHWQDVPSESWSYPSFSPEEISCRGDGKIVIDDKAMRMLQMLRDKLNKPLIVTSAYRSPEYNKQVGGASKSKHLLGEAFDIVMTNHDPAAFKAAAKQVGFLGFGDYPAQNFMHIDVGPERKWKGKRGGWYPTIVKETNPSFTPTPKPKTLQERLVTPEVLSGAGAILTGGAAVSQGNGPVQWALGIVLVVCAVAGLIFIIQKSKPDRADD